MGILDGITSAQLWRNHEAIVSIKIMNEKAIQQLHDQRAPKERLQKADSMLRELQLAYTKELDVEDRTFRIRRLSEIRKSCDELASLLERSELLQADRDKLVEQIIVEDMDVLTQWQQKKDQIRTDILSKVITHQCGIFSES
jgi:hypothetical protein